MKRRLFLGAVMAASLVGGVAYADFPESPITLIVPYSAGGGTDRTARLLVPFIETHLGNGASIVVVNRPGAGGAVGWTELAAANPNGYTIGMVNFPDVVTAPITNDVRFTPESFVYLGSINREPTTLSVPENSPFQTLEDLLEAAIESPGTLSAAAPGLRNVHNIGLSILASETGAIFNTIPFDGGGEARNAVLGGHVDVAALSLGAVAGREGLRILGQMSGDRADTGAGIPTFDEAVGVPVENFVIRTFAIPSGVPDDARMSLADAFRAAMEDPGLAQAAAEQRVDLTYLTGEEIAEISARLDRRLRALWDESPWFDAE